jgi:hypothetical protein
MSLGLGVGGAHVTSTSDDGAHDSGLGINFFINGLYNISENISAGLEFNGNLALIGSADGADIKATSIVGLLAKGRYAFGSAKVKPFVGLMAGLYTTEPGDVTLNGSTIGFVFDKKRTFGFAPEAGIRLGAFQLSMAYHIPGKYTADIIDLFGNERTIESNYKIWQFVLGFNIGIIKN